MKRFFSILLVIFMTVSLCACGQKKGYTEEEQNVINGLYRLKEEGEGMQKLYDEMDEERQELMCGVTEALYNANAREYKLTMALLSTTSVVIPEDLPEMLPEFQK